MANKGFGVIIGICLMPTLMIMSNGLDASVDRIIVENQSWGFLTHVKSAMYYLILATPVVLPFITWKRYRTFSQTLIISTILYVLLLVVMFVPRLNSG